MATLAKQLLTQGGITPTYAAAAAGLTDKAVPGEGVFLHIKNSNGASRAVVINDPTTPNPGAATQFDPDVTVTIPADTGDKMIPLPARFANPADGGLASWTYEAAAGVTVAVLQI